MCIRDRFFRALASYDYSAAQAAQSDDAQLVDVIAEAYYAPRQASSDQAMAEWLRRYSERLEQDSTAAGVRQASMNQVNPLYVPRNYLAQLAIDDAEKGDFARLHEWLDVLRQPYTEQPGQQAFAQKRPEWARSRVGCSMLSCSS